MQPRCCRSVCCAADATADAPRCAVSFAKETPPGDERQRDVCTTCGFVDYKNPKVVVAASSARRASMTSSLAIMNASAARSRSSSLSSSRTLGVPSRRVVRSETRSCALADPLWRRFATQATWSWARARVRAQRAKPWRRQAHLQSLARCWQSTTCQAACSSPISHVCAPRRTSGRDTSRPTYASFDGARSRGSFVAQSWRLTQTLRVRNRDELPAADELAFPTNAWALEYAREVLRRAPEGSAWRDCEELRDGDGTHDAPASAAWFAPQQRSKTAAPPGFIEG